MMKKLIVRYKTSLQAVIAANVSNFETISASFAAAAETKSDVILQIAPIQLKVQNISAATMVDLIQLVARNYDVVYSIHLDHAETFEECKEAIEAGFDSVMIDASAKSFADNIELSKQVVEFAKDYDVVVEAELGSFTTKEGEDGAESDSSLYTDPTQVASFIENTGIDLLAVSIGNAHGFYKGEPNINLEVLKNIQAESNIPLVLHGSTGIPGKTIRECIKRGVFKINVFTQLDSSFNEGFIKGVKEKNRMMFAQKSGQDAFQNALVKYMNIIKE